VFQCFKHNLARSLIAVLDETLSVPLVTVFVETGMGRHSQNNYIGHI